uniref:Ypar14, super integron cassette n=1 Tax=Thaumasiovibrio occultus TaxID=1891184 RepID=UPI000B357378|nr:Ypar14, super integron cassette [Thaumasiovibrio occultus]
MLTWDETDVLAVLEVLPEEDPHHIYHRYCVEKAGLRLIITVWQYDGDVEFELVDRTETRASPAFKMKLVDCQGVQRRVDASGEYLEFAPSACFGGRYTPHTSIAYGVRVAVKPNIAISLFG